MRLPSPRAQLAPTILAVVLEACGTRIQPLAAQVEERWLVLHEMDAAGDRALQELTGQGWRILGGTEVPGLSRVEAPPGARPIGLAGIRGGWRDVPHEGGVAAAGQMQGLNRFLGLSGHEGADLESRQWGLALVGAPEAWIAGYTGRGIPVAVVDSGLDPDHPDFLGAVDWSRSTNLVPEEAFVDLNGHGTHVAGLIGARRDGQGTTGIAPDCQLRIVKVLDRHGYGHDHVIMEGVLRAARDGARIINVSIGTRVRWGTPEAGALALAWDRTLREAARLGALVVTGTGNEGEAERTSGWTHLPAASPWALVASACGPQGGKEPTQRARYANFGPGLAEVLAPGGGIGVDESGKPVVLDPDDLVLSTWSRRAPSGQGWQPWAGTSMAAAHASGVAALAAGKHPDRPGLSLGQWLQATALATGTNQPPLTHAGRATQAWPFPRNPLSQPRSVATLLR